MNYTHEYFSLHFLRIRTFFPIHQHPDYIHTNTYNIAKRKKKRNVKECNTALVTSANVQSFLECSQLAP